MGSLEVRSMVGGQAHLIWGNIDEERLKPVPARRSFLDKLLGKPRFQQRCESELPDGTRLIELPAGDLERLPEDFARFLEQCIPAPWLATETFFDYLAEDIISIYLRGEHAPEKPSPDWYIQITFSGCAGLAEVSAELGSHWSEIWFKENRDRIFERYLEPFGFLPAENQAMPEKRPLFLPVGRLGYAMHVGEVEIDPEWPGSRLFELDAACTEAFELDGTLSRFQALDDKFGPVMSDGKCRCQLCMPDFDTSDMDEEFD